MRLVLPELLESQAKAHLVDLLLSTALVIHVDTASGVGVTRLENIRHQRGVPLVAFHSYVLSSDS